MRAAAWGLLAVTAAAVATPAAADVALEQLRRDSLAAGMVAFERTTTIRQGDGPPLVRVDRFDPGQPANAQWTLVSINGRAPTQEEVRQHQRQVAAQPVPGFHRLNSLLAGDPSTIERQGARTIYRWARLQKGAAPSGQGPDFSEQLSAEALVRTDGPRPVLEQVRIYAAEPFGVMGVAKINRFEAITRYGHGPRGHRLEAQQTEVDARVPFRRGGAMRTEATFRAL